jgi:hypothetical protein
MGLCGKEGDPLPYVVHIDGERGLVDWDSCKSLLIVNYGNWDV